MNLCLWSTRLVIAGTAIIALLVESAAHRERETCTNEEYRQRVDTLQCRDTYIRAIEDEIEQSSCKDLIFYNTRQNLSCETPVDERTDIPSCTPECSMIQYYHLLCTNIGEDYIEISKDCGHTEEEDGANFCGFDNGNFCIFRFEETKLAMGTCANESRNASQCTEECRTALEEYKEKVGCCVRYWREGVGDIGAGPSLADYFSVCNVEIPGPCTSFSPPEEFLSCARNSMSTDGTASTSGAIPIFADAGVLQHFVLLMVLPLFLGN